MVADLIEKKSEVNSGRAGLTAWYGKSFAMDLPFNRAQRRMRSFEKKHLFPERGHKKKARSFKHLHI